MGLFTFPNAPGMTGLHLGYPFLLCLGKQRWCYSFPAADGAAKTDKNAIMQGRSSRAAGVDGLGVICVYLLAYQWAPFKKNSRAGEIF